MGTPPAGSEASSSNSSSSPSELSEMRMSATQGGCVYARVGNVLVSGSKLRHCNGRFVGGGIRLWGATAVVRDTDIAESYADMVSCYSGGPQSVVFLHCCPSNSSTCALQSGSLQCQHLYLAQRLLRLATATAVLHCCYLVLAIAQPCTLWQHTRNCLLCKTSTPAVIRHMCASFL